MRATNLLSHKDFMRSVVDAYDVDATVEVADLNVAFCFELTNDAAHHVVDRYHGRCLCLDDDATIATADHSS